jgi:hypothetical protein
LFLRFCRESAGGATETPFGSALRGHERSAEASLFSNKTKKLKKTLAFRIDYYYHLQIEFAGGAKVETPEHIDTAKANRHVLAKLTDLYLEAFGHDGFAEIRVEMRILRRGQKEIILHCGKQYRFVVDCATV